MPLAGRQDKKTGLWMDGAGEKRDHARALLACKIDPAETREAEKAAGAAAGQNTFKVAAREWHAKQSGSWAKVAADAKLVRLEADLFPRIGSKPSSDLNAPALLKVLQAVEDRGANEIARRVRQMLWSDFPLCDLNGPHLGEPHSRSRRRLAACQSDPPAAITEPKAVGGLMRAIQDYQGEPVTRAALRLAPLVFVRPSELRAAEWQEFDLDEATWRMPGERMTMREAHTVPLSKQAVAILRELRSHTGNGRFVLPSIGSRARPMSANTVSAAYNRAEHLPERKKMLQAWADYLDKLTAEAAPTQEPTG